MPQAQPELRKYMEKRLFVQLNGNRKVIGVLRGYDVSIIIPARPIYIQSSPVQSTHLAPELTRLHQVFLNIVLDEAYEERPGGEKTRLGMVVIRGNSVVMLEALERMGDDRRDRG
ncbi:hypothetical protein LTR70_004431 [Exophiala xenobiotica]|uniref:Small nuclear ribonucleoprotein G n=1 Tax=Lithohypha guttulata TaxID=1690604 RepID=A0ABR0KDG1_9EURO|nr:hypothetical protein LTR24_003910 [Lithohypha guttulata]KAK5320853.1 hypothetical protein LTR70_004431 [Exophiala xenobiotica]